ncbi:hypothetical protein [Leekyejoonella antrihumi]|uniref:Type IV toxin-antitoxin system AbiEi family antitoxin domain-containing protein n=1 Tax=Leekyejoonella antrihumi TaxID=1660198 RepID=A0A563E9J3_9MICO|nr:hypothetical protein [Leekyejoonella antrihumi]TWP38912.1 hypothetical protein FGL98_00460 [Leekyejoonella antrihumi]
MSHGAATDPLHPADRLEPQPPWPDLRLVTAATLDRLGIDPARPAADGMLPFRRVRKGIYVCGPADLPPEEILLLRAYAVAAAAGGTPLFSHHTAAAAWGIPTIGRRPALIEHITAAGTTGRTPGVRRRRAQEIPNGVEVNGLMVTAPDRTVIDLAREVPLESGLAAADHALRERLCTTQDLRDQVDLLKPGARGRRKARLVIRLADAGSESVGESLSRARMFQLGIPRPVLQVRFDDEDGFIGRVDFWWEELGLIGEFDGRLKYRATPQLTAEQASQVLWKEKLREDRLRGGGRRRVARWVWNDALDSMQYQEVMRRHGLRTDAHETWDI